MVKVETYCGLSCSECDYRESCHCGGCIATNGKPFHGECEVAHCAQEKKRRFCGECPEFPCELLNRYSFDPEQGDNGQRIERCRQIKNTLVKEAREGLDTVSVCGHHCEYCFLAKWCGGCRSDYNCCSFATICSDGVCPNVACAKEKQLDGCYECDELAQCKLGYYANENEYTAKATAMFVKKYGKEVYHVALKKAIEDHVEYAKNFDETGSVEAALALLERYL